MPNIASVANNAQEKEEEQSEQNIQEITSSITARCLEFIYIFLFFSILGIEFRQIFKSRGFLIFVLIFQVCQTSFENSISYLCWQCCYFSCFGEYFSSNHQNFKKIQL